MPRHFYEVFMKRRLIYVVGALLLIGGVTVACQSTKAATAFPTATELPATATPVSEPTSTATPVPATKESAATPTQAATGAAAGPTPTPPWQIPEVSESDHVVGGENAAFVLVEYADFQ